MDEVKTRNLINMILEGEQEMDFMQDYFLCDSCQNKNFKQIYNFSIRFHGVNFSEDLIYDKLIDEIFQCGFWTAVSHNAASNVVCLLDDRATLLVAEPVVDLYEIVAGFMLLAYRCTSRLDIVETHQRLHVRWIAVHVVTRCEQTWPESKSILDLRAPLQMLRKTTKHENRG